MHTRLPLRRRLAEEPSAPFDVPAGDEYTGLRRHHDTLIGVLAIHPTAPAPVAVGASWPGDRRLLAAASETFATSDAAPASIDVVCHAMGCWSDAPAARAYRGLLGGLRIAAHRSVHVIVRIRPAEWPDAVRSRGGDGAGTLRTALWCLRRVRARLGDVGIAARPLSAAEISDLTVRLTEGASVAAAAETSIGLHHNGSPLVPYALRDPGPSSIAALLAAPVSADSISTTVTATLTPGPHLRVTVRDNGGRAVDRSGELGLELITADLPAAVAAGLPIGAPSSGRRTARQDRVAADADLLTVPVPFTGDGQVVGADASGRPVALRLAGYDVPRSDVSGDDALHRQSVARLAALGFTVAVASDNPERWARLASSAGPGLVTVGPPRHPVQAIIDDTTDGDISAPPGVTVVRMRPPECAPPPPGPTPVLRGSPDGASTVAEGAGRSIRIRPVSTAAERDLIGP